MVDLARTAQRPAGSPLRHCPYTSTSSILNKALRSSSTDLPIYTDSSEPPDFCSRPSAHPQALPRQSSHATDVFPYFCPRRAPRSYGPLRHRPYRLALFSYIADLTSPFLPYLRPTLQCYFPTRPPRRPGQSRHPCCPRAPAAQPIPPRARRHTLQHPRLATSRTHHGAPSLHPRPIRQYRARRSIFPLYAAWGGPASQCRLCHARARDHRRAKWRERWPGSRYPGRGAEWRGGALCIYAGEYAQLTREDLKEDGEQFDGGWRSRRRERYEQDHADL